MNIPTAWRGYIYVAAIVASVVVGVLVAFGVVSQEQVTQTVAVASSIATALIALLARLNLSE